VFHGYPQKPQESQWLYRIHGESCPEVFFSSERLPLPVSWGMMNWQRRTLFWRAASGREPFPLANRLLLELKREKESHMVRTRLASLALATGLALVSGCLNLGEGPLLGRFRANGCCEGGCESGCCNGGVAGPILNGMEGMPAPPPPPEGVMPLPTAPPRLVPTPQAPTMPYVPPG
jgi:hypothetical protein